MAYSKYLSEDLTYESGTEKDDELETFYNNMVKVEVFFETLNVKTTVESAMYSVSILLLPTFIPTD